MIYKQKLVAVFSILQFRGVFSSHDSPRCSSKPKKKNTVIPWFLTHFDMKFCPSTHHLCGVRHASQKQSMMSTEEPLHYSSWENWLGPRRTSQNQLTMSTKVTLYSGVCLGQGIWLCYFICYTYNSQHGIKLSLILRRLSFLKSQQLPR